MASRPRHPDKDLEKVLKRAESQGWDVTKRGRYFKMKCGCPDKHLKTVHISPSGGYYETHLRQMLRTKTCWKEES